MFELVAKLNSNEKNRRYEINAWKDVENFHAILSIPRSEKDLDFKHLYQAEVYIHPVAKTYQDFQFDYAKYLSRKGIFLQGYLPRDFKTAEKKQLTFSEKIKQKRLELLKKIDALPISKKSREFTKGIILADRSEMDKEMVQDFSKSGLVHILAISGSHIAIIFWLILSVLKPIFPSRARNLKIIIALLLIWAFAVFINYGSSVVRSCIMISCYYIFVLLQRKTDLLHSMALAAFFILMVNSNELYDVGFQLSFIAVFGIFWLNQPILNWLPRTRNRIQRFLANVVSISLSAQIATLPLVLFYFHQYSYLSIIANFVIIPFSELLIIFALLMTVLAEFSISISLINHVYDAFVKEILQIIHFFGNADFAFFEMIPMTLIEVISAFLIVLALRKTLQRFDLNNLSKLAFLLITFVSLRLLLNYKASELDEVISHRFFKDKVVSVKNKGSITFIYFKNLDADKVKNYVIAPYLTSRRNKNFSTKLLEEDTHFVEINGAKYRFK